MSSAELQRLRTQAVNDVASNRGVTPPTVSNKYRREMRPDVDGTAEFDEAVRTWLIEGSNELERVLRKHAVTNRDLSEIDRFFDVDTTEAGGSHSAGSGAETRSESGGLSHLGEVEPSGSDFRQALLYAVEVHADQTRKDPEKTP